MKHKTLEPTPTRKQLRECNRVYTEADAEYHTAYCYAAHGHSDRCRVCGLRNARKHSEAPTRSSGLCYG